MKERGRRWKDGEEEEREREKMKCGWRKTEVVRETGNQVMSSHVDDQPPPTLLLLLTASTILLPSSFIPQNSLEWISTNPTSIHSGFIRDGMQQSVSTGGLKSGVWGFSPVHHHRPSLHQTPWESRGGNPRAQLVPSRRMTALQPRRCVRDCRSIGPESPSRYIQLLLAIGSNSRYIYCVHFACWGWTGESK
ncbi:hypothetical protein BDV59DRAFT_177981 [Aspergillus ambiguus]|uniref:uncharacterized protein n=1 Tax=Aspergillus ambiguus TaxID=176160 RepID=UPI003CCD4615